MHIGILPSLSSVDSCAATYTSVIDTSHRRNGLTGHIRVNLFHISDRRLDIDGILVHPGWVVRDQKRYIKNAQTGFWLVSMVHDSDGNFSGFIAGLLDEGNS